MLIIGLTGGIGSGKSTVADMFAARGITVVDSDVIARELTAANTEGFDAIVKQFGATIVNEQGNLDRKALRQHIFNHPKDRLWLEQYLHPRIRMRMAERVLENPTAYAILVIPLLVENLPNPLIQRILVVDTPEAMQIERVSARDQHSKDEVLSIIEAQAKREERLQMADDVIENTGDLKTLDHEVARLHDLYLHLAQNG